MFERLGALIAHRPRTVIAVWLSASLMCLALSLGLVGPGLFSQLSANEPRIPGAESELANEVLRDASSATSQTTLLVRGVDLDSAEVVAGLAEPLARNRAEIGAVDGVLAVVDPWILPQGPADPAASVLVSQSADAFLVTVELDATGDAEGEVHELLTALPDDLAEVAPEATGLLSSGSLIEEAIIGQMERDLIRGEAVALPLSLMVMVIVFGGLIAAGIPLLAAVATIATSLGALVGMAQLMDLDSVVVNVVSVIGLGLSIDYGLLVVSRFREELQRAIEGEEAGRRVRRRRSDQVVTGALVRTMATAGRTVAFSALVIALSVSGLLLLSPDILRSLGIGGVFAVLLALATALTLVPALIALRGRRLMEPSVLSRVPGVRRIVAKLGDVAPQEGFFSRLAARVQRRPVLVLLGVMAILVTLTLPLGHLQLRSSTVDLLPQNSDQREFLAVIAEDFPTATMAPIQVIVPGPPESAAGLFEAIVALDEVDSVDPPLPLDAAGAHTLIGARPPGSDAGGAEATEAVRAIRDAGLGEGVWVTGQAANQIDFGAALLAGAPFAGGLVVAATFVLLFLMTGSLLVPAKALAVNLLSLGASLGVATWVFQDGHLADLLGFTPVGGLENYVVAIVLAFGFGLAMDYEVFLLSRIKELYDSGMGNDDAVKYGLQRSGRIITSAALVIIVVFAGFGAGEMIAIKEVGVALAVTVFIDATLVRMLLVPATMTLLGDWNWWAPGPLRRLHERFSLAH